jgi:hypothetical protein
MDGCLKRIKHLKIDISAKKKTFFQTPYKYKKFRNKLFFSNSLSHDFRYFWNFDGRPSTQNFLFELFLIPLEKY